MGTDLRAVTVCGDNAGVAGHADRFDAGGCSERLRVDDCNDRSCCNGCVGCGEPVDCPAWDGCAV